MNDDNEAVSAARAADQARKARLVRTGVAVGIGSAAIAAALLYARSSGKKPGGSD